MEFRILGALEVRDGGRRVPLGAGKQRATLAILLLHANQVVPTERLIDELWAESPPETARKAVHVYLTRLRKALGPQRIRTHDPGYVLELEPGELDLDRFQRLVRKARGLRAEGEPADAAATLRDALALWNGPPLADFTYEPFAQAEISRLEDQRLEAVEERIDADLALGHGADLVGELEELVAQHPYRERLRGQLMLALYRDGRQADALAVYQETRKLLVDELGIEPGPALQRLEGAILRQEPALETVLEEPATAPPSRTRRRRRWRLAAAGAGLALVAGAVAFVLSLGGSQESLDTAAGNSLAILDLRSRRLVADVLVGTTPTDVAVGEGAAWVTNADSGTVDRVDPLTRTVRQSIRVGSGPAGVAVGEGSVWVTNSLDGSVSRIDPRSNEVTQTIGVGNGPSGIAVGAGSVWVVNRDDHTLSRIDSETGTVAQPFAVGTGPVDVAVGAHAVWVTNESVGKILKVDPRSGRVVGSVSVGRGPTAVAVGAGSVWATNALDGTVSRVDPETLTVTATIPVGEGPSGIAPGRDVVLVSVEHDGAISRIDPATNDATPISIGGRPAGVARGAQDVFVAVRPAGDAHRGGKLTVLEFYAAYDSIDPARAYEPPSWRLLSLTNDGLTAFKRVGGREGARVVPDLATSVPEPTESGTIYTFLLRPGLRYSTGAAVRATDFRRALERVFELRSVTYPYEGIVGAESCLRRRGSCDLSRGVVADNGDRTVTFHLTEADPDFPAKLALPFAFAVPSDTPNRDTGRRPLPATGPYMVASYVPRRQARLVRNPHFREGSRAARPSGYSDEIVIRLDVSETARKRAVARGEADVADLLPATELGMLRARYGSRLHLNPRLGIFFVFLNTQRSPFDDIRVRRAVNYAVDRFQVARAFGGPDRFPPTCQVLPPNFPGYRRYCPYPNDLAVAGRLVAASGTQGDRVVVWSLDVAAEGTSRLVSTLRSLGYRAGLKVVDSDRYYDALGKAGNSVQAGFNSWVADYPSAAGFVRPVLSCAAIIEGANFSRFCDRTVEREVDRALALQASDPLAANEAWARVDRLLVDRAPLVPLVSQTAAYFVSERVGNYQSHPLWGPLLDQLWVE
jgi:peptide/nickel transport system substrate-binding protein